MTKANFSILFIVLSAHLCLAQQKAPIIQHGEAFHGNIRTIRIENARLRRGSNGEPVEEPAVLQSLTTYSEDLLTRESSSYQPDGSVFLRSVATHLPNGSLGSLAVRLSDGTFLSRLVYEYDEEGHQISLTSYNSDGSIKERTLIQVARTNNQITGATWSDGHRSESSSVVDEAGTRHNEAITYKTDGSISGKRVWTVDAGANRSEATEYNADGSVQERTLQTREYDSRHNLAKLTDHKWNAYSQKFEVSTITYYKIIYRD